MHEFKICEFCSPFFIPFSSFLSKHALKVVIFIIFFFVRKKNGTTRKKVSKPTAINPLPEKIEFHLCIFV